MKQIIKITDKYNPQDTMTHGFVNIMDSEGKKVVQKCNMIVGTGRALIKQAMIARLNNAKVYLGNNGGTPSTPGMTYGDLSGIKILETGATIDARPYFTYRPEGGENILVVDGEDYKNSDGNYVTSVPEGLDVTGDTFIRIVADIPNGENDLKEISELGIVVDNTLFSRVCFDTIYVTENDNFTLIYYIYF